MNTMIRTSSRQNPGTGRRSSRALALASVLVLLALVPPAHGVAVKEYQLKGAFVFNFARYVHWPTDMGMLHVCVVGNDKVSSIFGGVMKGKATDGHALAVRTLSALGEAADCEILFVARSAGIEPEEVTAAAVGGAVLTIGETPGFATRGGVVNFTIDAKGKIRFEINERVAHERGLEISSKLLRLATLVGDRH